MKLLTHDERPDLVELLTILSEEAAEISKACSKIIRFGLTAHNPSSPISNLQELSAELTDILTVIGVVIEMGNMGISRAEVANDDRVNAKLHKISQHTTYWTHVNDSANLPHY